MEHKEYGVAEILRRAGLRATSPRQTVLSYLQKTSCPLSIKEIHAKFPRINQVTLYRMMDTFSVAGIVTRIDLGEGSASFEFKGDEDHHHIVCIGCRKIEDFNDTAHERLQKKILARSKSFASIVTHSFELFGLCRSCVKSRAA